MAPPLKRAMYHSQPKGPTEGFDVKTAKFAVHRYETGLLPKPVTGFTKQFGPALREALVKVIQPREGIKPTGNIGQATWDVLWTYLDDYRRMLYRAWKVPTIPKPDPVPDLGSLYIGGASALNHSLTHRTSGITEEGSVWPAYDDGWVYGRTVLAVEHITVYKQSGSAGGDAVFCQGASKLHYWYGHLAVAPATGRSFSKGERVGTIANLTAAQGYPHVHLGINARPLIGHDFIHNTNYQPGAPTVGSQLREAMSLGFDL